MKDSQFKTLQKWFETLNERMTTLEKTVAKKSDIEKIHQSIDAVHGMIHQTHRRIDHHLSDDDSEKRLFRLALERLDDRVMSLERKF